MPILYKKNAKKHPDKQLKQIANSLREFGWRQPIVVDKDDVIIVGHGRWLAYQKFPEGIKEPWIIKADDLTDEQVKAYRLADNKLNESEWDVDLAVEGLKELSDEMFELTGFDRDLLVDVKEDDFDVQAEYDKILEPVSKLGDLWALGEHRLLCGDSTLKASYGALFAPQGQEKEVLANMVFTDPPYNVGYDYTGVYKKGKKANVPEVRFNDKKLPEEYKNFIYDVFKNANDFTKEGSPLYCWHASRMEIYVRSGLELAGWFVSQTIVWLKDRMVFSPGQDYHRVYEPCYFGWKQGKKHFVNKKGHGAEKDFLLLNRQDFEECLNVMYEKKDKIIDYIHPTQKPLKLAERALKYHSNIGSIVLEPFNGSGSTMMACEQLKRKCYAIELDPKYVDVAIKRWELATGQKAQKII